MNMTKELYTMGKARIIVLAPIIYLIIIVNNNNLNLNAHACLDFCHI